MPSGFTSDLGHAGRGTPEFCSLEYTIPGVDYLVVLETWSAPLDDDRLGYAFLVAQDKCDQQYAVQDEFGNITTITSVFSRSGVNLTAPEDLECLLQGESVDPDIAGEDYGPWFGIDEVPSRPGSVNFEQVFCSNSSLYDYCATEANDVDCSEERCFCGDPANTPSGGSF